MNAWVHITRKTGREKLLQPTKNSEGRLLLSGRGEGSFKLVDEETRLRALES
jgi:hypothetical protein